MEIRCKRCSWDPDNQLLLVKKNNTICIPRGGGRRHQLFHEAHDTELAGQFGTSRTYNALNKRFFWPRMLASVKSYVSTRDCCQWVKGSKKLGPLTLLPVAEGRWTRIDMDFVPGLSTSNYRNDCTCTIIDDMTNRAPWFELQEHT